MCPYHSGAVGFKERSGHQRPAHLLSFADLDLVTAKGVRPLSLHLSLLNNKTQSRRASVKNSGGGECKARSPIWHVGQCVHVGWCVPERSFMLQ